MKRVILAFILIIGCICMVPGCGKIEDESNLSSKSDLDFDENTSNNNGVSNKNHSFEVYIGEFENNLHVKNRAQRALNEDHSLKDQFVLNEAPLFTHEDIKAYLWQTHEVLFTDAFLANRLDNVRDNVDNYRYEGGSLLLNADSGDIFVVVVNGERIYHGYFPKAAHSSSSTIGMIMKDIDYGVRIRPNYNYSEDLREDNRIYNALNSLGILGEEPVSQLIHDETYYHRAYEILVKNIEEMLELLEQEHTGECDRSTLMTDMAYNIQVDDGIVYYPMNYTIEDYYYQCKFKGTPLDSSNYSWEVVDIVKLNDVKSLINFATQHFIDDYMEVHGDNVKDFKIESARYKGESDTGGYMVSIDYLVLPIDDTKPPSLKGFVEPKSGGYYWSSRLLFVDKIDGAYIYREVVIH